MVVFFFFNFTLSASIINLKKTVIEISAYSLMCEQAVERGDEEVYIRVMFQDFHISVFQRTCLINLSVLSIAV